MMLIRTGRSARPREAESEPEYQAAPQLVQEAPSELTAAPTLDQTVCARHEAGHSQRAIARELALSVTSHRQFIGPAVLAQFRVAMAPYGPPALTLTDNGMPFTTRFSGGRGGRNALE